MCHRLGSQQNGAAQVVEPTHVSAFLIERTANLRVPGAKDVPYVRRRQPISLGLDMFPYHGQDKIFLAHPVSLSQTIWQLMIDGQGFGAASHSAQKGKPDPHVLVVCYGQACVETAGGIET